MRKDRFDDPFAWVGQAAMDEKESRSALHCVKISERGKFLAATNSYTIHITRISRGVRSPFRDGLFHSKTGERIKNPNLAYPDINRHIAVPESWQAMSLDKYRALIAWLEGATLAFKKDATYRGDFTIRYGDTCYKPGFLLQAFKGIVPAKFNSSNPDIELGQYDALGCRMLMVRSRCDGEERIALVVNWRNPNPTHYNLSEFLSFISVD